MSQNSLVALFLKKSELMVLAIFGVWKAGAAYVPIDPNYPQERIDFILKDTKAEIIISTSKLSAKLKPMSNTKLHLIEMNNIDLTSYAKNNPASVENNGLSYVMYTSGSTGVPKGVVKDHKCVVNSIRYLSMEYKLREQEEVVALFSAYVFEPFLRQMLMALLNGQKLVVVKERIKRDPLKFVRFLEDNCITILNGTASVLQEYDYSKCKHLRKLIFAGEELTTHCFNCIRETYKGEIINEYGPTECAFVTTLKDYQYGDMRKNRSIGKPARNVICYVLDENMNKLPEDTIGKLFIGGAGVAIGYLNQPDLAADKFLENPFQTDKEKLGGRNARIYDTGDLARWLPNGELEYIGRNDFQVKINGFRVELQEIELALLSYDAIKNSIVITSDAIVKSNRPFNKFLIGYYVTKDKIKISENDLKTFLLTKLPVYMIPKRILQINKIPVTINGKTDLRALAKIYNVAIKNYHIKRVEKTELESLLTEIWSELLRIPTESIDILDDLFQIGGDSIIVIQIIGEIRRKLHIEVTTEEIFKLRTIRNLALLCAKKKCQGKIETEFQNYDTISEVILPNEFTPRSKKINDVQAIYHANSLQQCFMYNHIKANDETYVIQYVCKYASRLNLELMKKAWLYAQKRFPSLRLRFQIQDNEIFQVVDHEQPLDWRFVDITSEKQQEKEVEIIQVQDSKERYQLEEGRLFRVYLIKRQDDLYNLIFSCHHIILDGWSIAILFDFMHEVYWKLLNGEKITTVQDSAYEASQLYLEQSHPEDIKYWENILDDVSEKCDLNGLLREEKKYKTTISELSHIFNQKEAILFVKKELHYKLKKLCIDQAVTLNSVLEYAWHKLLSIYGNCQQTVVATVVSGRNIPINGVENSVGLYINTLPLVANHNELDECSIIDAIRKIQASVFAMSSHTKVKLSDWKKSGFDCLFMCENYRSIKNQKYKTSIETFLEFEVVSTKEKLDFPLTTIACEAEDHIKISIVYDDELFEEKIIQQLQDMLKEILHQIVENVHSKIREIELLCPKQRLMMDKWNNEDKKEWQYAQTLHELFETVAIKFPLKIAVVYEERKLTYQELNKRANQLAFDLRQKSQVKPDSLVALFLEKSELMVLSILGVWKSGAAYVPIDPSYPDQRIQFILGDTNAKIVIANQRFHSRLRHLLDEDVVLIEAENYSTENILFTSYENLAPISSSTDLAYVIYTSGTTGNPKGVMIEHIGVVNLYMALSDIFALREKDEAILSFSNYVFDHFIEQMIDALLNGQKLVILEDQMRMDKKRLYEYMEANDVTYLSGTPSVLKMYEYNTFDSSSLRRIDAVGEDFTEATFNDIRSMFSGLIINGYGPTEVSITTHKKLYYYDEKRRNKSIGRQIANITCYVLNEKMKRVPIGAIGELYLGGIGVARGYLNRPDLTADKFLPNPFQTDFEQLEGKNARIYKTGDLVRWLPNGEVEYLGRNDFQVKINGVRIELSEIEAVLSSFHGIRQAVVIAKNISKNDSTSTKKYLIGYYISEECLLEQNIKTYLQEKLPMHMIPNRLVRIDKIPVNISGKLDTKSLPHVEFTSNLENYEPPKNELQTKLCHIWSEVLEIPVDEIGINDDFFNLGGDSIMAVKLYFAISREFSTNITSNIFQHRNIKNMSKYLQRHEVQNQHDNILPIKKQKELLSFAQERLLFIDQYEHGTSAYNIGIHYGLEKNIDLDALKIALLSIIRRHDILRTLILPAEYGKETFLQHTLDYESAEALFEIKQIAVRDTDNLCKEILNAVNHRFDLEKEIPIRVYFYYEKGFYTHMSIVVHHISFDGWSQWIFERDLIAFYNFFKKCDSQRVISNKEVGCANISPLNITYRDYVAWQRNILDEQKLTHLMDYWKNKLNNYELLNLPTDFKRPIHFDYQAGQELRFELNEDTTKQLKELAKMLNISFYSLLFGAYCLMLGCYAKQKSIVVGAPFTTRNQPELEQLIGLFVNMLVLRVDINPDQQLIRYLQEVSSEIITTQKHQDIPFEKLVKELNVDKDLSRHPIFQVVFNNEEIRKTSFESKDINSDDEQLKITPFIPSSTNKTTSKYDLMTAICNTNPKIQGYVNFNTKLFHLSTVQNMLDSYINVLHQLAQHMEAQQIEEICLKDVKWIDETMGQTLTCWKNEEKQELPSVQTLHELFESVAIKFPSKTAVMCEKRTMTYEELNEKAKNLAQDLRKTGQAKTDSLVALFLEKSELIVLSILGVWKSGAAYVPIDPSNPDQRVQFILEDVKPKIVIANQRFHSRLRHLLDEDVILIEAENYSTIKIPSIDQNNLITTTTMNASSSNLAYVIYTSGSTGQPKGVLIEHGSVLNFYNDISNRYFNILTNNSTHQETILFLSNYAFDFSIEQLILSIFCGNKLVILPEDLAIGGEDFYDYLKYTGLSYISGTPSQLQMINFGRLNNLQMITVAGEAFQKCHFEHIRQNFTGSLINAYGTTETTIYNLVEIYSRHDVFVNSIGRPLKNTRIYVLDDSLREVPPGAIGDLFLAGNCVSRGYLNRPSSTEKSFIKNLFQTDEEKRNNLFGTLYKTGDLVRWTNDGKLEYIGRDDLQVKINGMRLELTEIEEVLSKIPRIKQCAVVVENYNENGINSGKKHIVAYFVTEDNIEMDEDNLIEYMTDKLPISMIPKLMIHVKDVLPVTSNGKLDHKALPKPNCFSTNSYEPPRNTLEQKLCIIWADVLDVPTVGINDDFFALGGDSILLMQLVEQMRTNLSLKISLKEVFIHRCIKKLSTVLSNRSQQNGNLDENNNRLLKRNFSKELNVFSGLLAIQKWFFEKKLENLHHWNQSFTIRTPTSLGLQKLKSVLDQLFSLHGAFRLLFKKIDSMNSTAYVQYYVKPDVTNNFELKTFNMENTNKEILKEELKQSQRKFNIYNGPLFCVYYVHGFKDGSARLVFTMHHLIIDTVSWRIICRDLERLYNGGDLSRYRSPCYLHWVQAMEEYHFTNLNSKEKLYWENLAKKTEAFNMKLINISDMNNNDSKKAAFEFSLSYAQTECLLRHCLQMFDVKNVDTILLAALSHALTQSITHEQFNYITLEGHGREADINPELDVTSTVGWFTTMFPVEIYTTKHGNIKEDIDHVKKYVQSSIPNNGIGYGSFIGYDQRLPCISYNNLGMLNKKRSQKQNAWELIEINEDYGERDDSSVLSDNDILGVLVFYSEEKMHFKINSKLDAQKSENFMHCFKTRIEEIITSSTSENLQIDHLNGFETYVEFASEKHLKKGTIFMLPPGEGGAESYFRIIHKFSAFDLIIFNNYYLYAKNQNIKHAKELTFEALATVYIAYIKRIQPQGPYTFMGWSFGGLLALEIARQLVSNGDRVDNLIFIDSYFNVPLALKSSIGEMDDAVIDKINIMYCRKKEDYNNIASNITNIVLFRATKLNTMYKTNRQKSFYEYYMGTECNNLETIIDRGSIKLLNMAEDTHVSWIFNENQTTDMSNYVLSLFK